MKTLKKMMMIGVAAIMAVSAMSMSAFAAELDESRKIDYSIYDSDMVYVQEHADMVAKQNEELLKSRAVSYIKWDWSNGIYSRTTGSTSGLTLAYYFTPVYNYLYFNVGVNSVSTTPYMVVSKYLSSGGTSYVGTYYINSIGNNNYRWSNYKRSLDAGTNYVFGVFSDSSWSSAYIDINKISF